MFALQIRLLFYLSVGYKMGDAFAVSYFTGQRILSVQEGENRPLSFYR